MGTETSSSSSDGAPDGPCAPGAQARDGEWALVRAAFAQAADLAAAEQEARVRAVCGSNDRAIGEALALLAADRGSGGRGASTNACIAAAAFAQSGAGREPTGATWRLASGGGVRLLNSVLGAPATERDEEFLDPPASIGTYTEVRPLARGGNGMVFSAVQAHPRREVAIKVLRARHIATGATRRFEREGHVLAQLGHPSIAAVYEVGIESPDVPGSRGRPYIVMELVRGMTITEFCTAHGLTREERIGLIVQVCRAVAHANTSGVIHRDIKPSNLMVAEHERGKKPGEWSKAAVSGAAAAWLDCSDRFLVKVLDFGIAKLAQDLWGAQSQATEEGQLVGTIDYMSPEQAAGGPGAAKPTSDVFSIGMVLYELLAGRPARAVPRQNMMAALMHIADETIPNLASVSPGCGGELAAVVHKAIHADPAERYRTADDLALDLVRYLRGEPVTARARTALVALRSWARRYPRAAGLTGVTLVVLAALMALLVRQNAEERASTRMATRAMISLVTHAKGQAWIKGTAAERERLLADAAPLFTAWIAQHPDDAEAHEAMAKLQVALYDHSVGLSREEPEHVRLAMDHTERSMRLRGRVSVEQDRFYSDLIVRLGDIEIHRGQYARAVGLWTRAWDRQAAASAANPGDEGLLDDLCWAEMRLLDGYLWLDQQEGFDRHVAGLRRSVSRLVEMAPERPLTLWAWLNAEAMQARLAHRNDDLEAGMMHRVSSVHIGKSLCALVPENREYAYALVRNCYAAAIVVTRVEIKRRNDGLPTSDLPLAASFFADARDLIDDLGRTECMDEAYWRLREDEEASAALIALARNDPDANADHKRANLRLAEQRLAHFPLSVDAASAVLLLREAVAGVELRGRKRLTPAAP